MTVRAPRVVVAAGALESPALLLRTGIGGPAVGAPAPAPVHRVAGEYEHGHAAPGGARRTPALVNEFADVEDGYGFLIEATQYATGIGASALPFMPAPNTSRRWPSSRTPPRSSASCATTGTAG